MWEQRSFSEVILKHQLNLPRPLRSEYLAIVGCPGRVLSAVLFSKTEDRSVGKVRYIHAEFDSLRFGDPEVLGDAQIRGLDPGTVERADLTITEGPRSGTGDRGWIQKVHAL